MMDIVITVEWVNIRDDRIYIAYSYNGVVRVVEPFTVPEPPYSPQEPIWLNPQ
jgi:hypothetical protein